MRLKANLEADAALVLTTVIWGSTFAFSKDILDHWPPLFYVGLRMAAAGALLSALFARTLATASRREWAAGATLGLLLGAGLAGQTVGQVYTTAAKSAFVTGLTTPLVPFVAYLLFRARPSRENFVGVALASVGGLLILAPRGEQLTTAAVGGAAVNAGDVITLFCTVLFAAHITLMSLYARRHDVRRLTVAQILTAAALLAAAWGALQIYSAASGAGAQQMPRAFEREFAPLAVNAAVLWRFAYMVVVATVLNFLLWTWAQGRMSATHAAIIFSLEPVFATLFAVALRGAGEWPGGWAANAGAALIIAGVVVSELRWGRRAKGDREDEEPESEEEAVTGHGAGV
ncbi:MAG TPA: DMT family transporter [Pyrinomonadaceae bacterium]|nr:DMT family transporter [Pyrinomonadaceae bacterium]